MYSLVVSTELTCHQYTLDTFIICFEDSVHLSWPKFMGYYTFKGHFVWFVEYENVIVIEKIKK